MGQHWKAVNLDKHEFISPNALDAGSKLGELLGSRVGSALIILCAAMPVRRGGGDFDLDSNFYGPERTDEMALGAPVNEQYNAIAHRTIGRWAGNHIALIGEYAKDSDLPEEFKASEIYGHCSNGGWIDVTADVLKVIEHETSA